MNNNVTFETIEREVGNRYRNWKQRTRKTSMISEDYKEMVKKIFSDFQLDPKTDPVAERWHRTIMTSKGSKGGIATREKKGSIQVAEDPQQEFVF